MTPIVELDETGALSHCAPQIIDRSREECAKGLATLRSRSGAGAEFTGWMALPEQPQEELNRILETAQTIREEADVLIVIGIGGSYLGARAVIDACEHNTEGVSPEVLYAGHHLSGRYLASLLDSLADRRVCVNVVSKSGTTTEPALAFRAVKLWMERRYGRDGASRRILATTDAERGALRGLAASEGYRTFVIPDDVGGRFSVLTPVGLLPIAAAGIDIRALLSGASRRKETALLADFDSNPALRYAAARTALSEAGKGVELLAVFEPCLSMLTEWWKQLFGESEGKEGRGIFPASVIDTTDLHSLGQFIQEGRRLLFETFLIVRESGGTFIVPPMEGDADGLGYLEGRDLSWINERAMQGTALAHSEGGTPVMRLEIEGIDPYAVGALLYMFQVAVAVSGYSAGVNPFDQPGVEAYKRNMFALLGKPGYEKEGDELRRKLSSAGR